MKKFLLVLIVLSAFVLTGCASRSGESYDALSEKYNALEEKYLSLREKYDELCGEKEELQTSYDKAQQYEYAVESEFRIYEEDIGLVSYFFEDDSEVTFSDAADTFSQIEKSYHRFVDAIRDID